MTSSPETNSYVIDPENAAEMARLIKQDRLFTQAMGSLFAEQGDLSSVHDILDIGCGPGGWVLDVANEYPKKRVIGIDISTQMIEYAQYLAEEQNRFNVQFQVMDALKPLAFADASFDLINARTIIGFVRQHNWPSLLQEYSRLLCPGGIVRFTEADDWSSTTSPSLDRLFQISAQAFYQAQYSFSPRNFSIAPWLLSFLKDARYQDIQKRAYIVDFSTGTPHHEAWTHNYMVTFKLLQPFLVKVSGSTEEEILTLYQRAVAEMQDPHFHGTLFFFTISGRKPEERA